VVPGQTGKFDPFLMFSMQIILHEIVSMGIRDGSLLLKHPPRTGSAEQLIASLVSGRTTIPNG
jgi:hypothetical protein